MCFVQKDINMTSGREGVCEYNFFFTKLSNFDEFVSDFLKTALLLCKLLFLQIHPNLFLKHKTGLSKKKSKCIENRHDIFGRVVGVFKKVTFMSFCAKHIFTSSLKTPI